MIEENEKDPDGTGRMSEDDPQESPEPQGSPEAQKSPENPEGIEEGVAADSAETAGSETGDEIAPDSELAEALREKDQFRAMAQRAQADFVNFRSRVEAENAEIRHRSARSLVMKILEVADSVDSALETGANSDVNQNFVDGVEAISRSLETFLSGEGVEKFNSVGEKFDPRLHEALMRTESADHPSDTVMRVMRAGYRMGEDVLRPAFVEVAAPPAAPGAEDGDAPDSNS